LIVRADVNQKAQQITKKKLFTSIFEFADALTINVLSPLDPREHFFEM
jgi:hypothetical protein